MDYQVIVNVSAPQEGAVCQSCNERKPFVLSVVGLDNLPTGVTQLIELIGLDAKKTLDHICLDCILKLGSTLTESPLLDSLIE